MRNSKAKRLRKQLNIKQIPVEDRVYLRKNEKEYQIPVINVKEGKVDVKTGVKHTAYAQILKIKLRRLK